MYTGWQGSSHYSSSRQPECGTENGESSLATVDLHVRGTHSDAGCKVRSGGDGNGARLASSKLGLQTGLHTLCTSIVREGRGGEGRGGELLASDIIPYSGYFSGGGGAKFRENLNLGYFVEIFS